MPKHLIMTPKILEMLRSRDKETQTLGLVLMGYDPITRQCYEVLDMYPMGVQKIPTPHTPFADGMNPTKPAPTSPESLPSVAFFNATFPGKLSAFISLSKCFCRTGQ